MCRRLLSSVEPQLCRESSFAHFSFFSHHTFTTFPVSPHILTSWLNTSRYTQQSLSLFSLRFLFTQENPDTFRNEKTSSTELPVISTLIIQSQKKHLAERALNAHSHYHLQMRQSGACWFVHESGVLPAITVCCKMTAFTPEGDEVMSRGDAEVGQLLGVCYLMHIH